MPGVAGLRGQSLGPAFVKPGTTLLPGLRGVLGLVPRAKPIVLTADPPNLSVGTENTSVSTAYVTLTPEPKRRGEVYAVNWVQVSGIVGVASDPKSLRTRFDFAGLSIGSFPQAWRALVTNNYGEAGVIEVSFTVSRSYPALSGSGSPSSQQLVPINPTTRIGTCYFSAAGIGGVPPYTYDWGGGNNPTSASNSADIYLPPGSPSGIDFSPGCTITDAVGQTVTVGAGPFFVYEA